MRTSDQVTMATAVIFTVCVLTFTFFRTEYGPELRLLRGRPQPLPPPSAPPPPTTPVPAAPASWDDFYDYLQRKKPCKKMKKYGGRGGLDGSKMVCLDPGLAPVPGACTVLSFGISTDWSFDDAMENFGCKVYSFDPSLNLADHVRHRNIHFYKLGISDRWKTVQFKRLSGQLDTYRGILKKINETDKVIDYLKIDTEGAEIQFFENVLYEDAELLGRVKQVGMEIHPNKDTSRRDKLWQYIHKLQTLNFRQIFVEKNNFGAFKHNGRSVSGAFELVWVNDRFSSSQAART